jgi:uncharacterized membrane protein YphA (DoxX/SURF4 family)
MPRPDPLPGTDEPHFVDAILAWRPTWFLARLLLVGAYLLGGIVKASDWPAAVAEQAHFGMHPPQLWAALTIAVEFIGPILVLSGRLVWLGAGMLGVFTALAILLVHRFWAMEGEQGLYAMFFALEHIGLIGGLILVSIISVQPRRTSRYA